jgi:eukaryotic-like serine/threonine-protein kinase
MINFEDLTIMQEIGRGSHGIVYSAEGPDKKTYAVKVLNRCNDYSIKRFQNEHLILNSIKDKSIIKVYNSGKSADNKNYMIMEFFEGANLKEIMSDPNIKLKLKTKIRLIKKISLALGAAHRTHIVHRDIKPSNILINLHTDEVRITDFGIALLPESTLTQAIDLLGTPGYLSPEGFQNPKVSPASDIYSLGAVAYEFFLGQAIFDLKSIRKSYDLGLKTLTENPLAPYKINKKFPANLSQILEKMLKKNPKARYQNGSVVAEALDNVLKGGLSKTGLFTSRKWSTKSIKK